MENDNESPAQDPNLPDEGNEVEDNGAEERTAGLQKRIDELTAERGSYERQAAALRDQNLSLLAAGVTQRQAAPEVDPYPDMDPSVKKMLSDTVGGIKREFGAQIAQINQRHESELMARDAMQSAAAMGASEEIQKEAGALARALRAKGLPITSEDAAVFALGTAVKEGRYKPAGNQRQGAPATLGSVRSANLQSQSTAPLPSNFDELDPDAQIALLNKRGAGNIPL